MEKYVKLNKKETNDACGPGPNMDWRPHFQKKGGAQIWEFGGSGAKWNARRGKPENESEVHLCEKN